MGTSVAGLRTRILVITIEIELFRLVRSVLELGGFTVHSAGPSGGGSKMDGPFDVVVFDLPSLDLDNLREAKRTYSDAQFVAICGLIAKRIASPFWIWTLITSLAPSARKTYRRVCAWPPYGAST